jgi:hypothetical protein
MATRIATSLNLVDEETINNARSCISLVEIGVVPSAFQVRLGGVKGVLAVHPTLPYLKNDRVVHIQGNFLNHMHTLLISISTTKYG